MRRFRYGRRAIFNTLNPALKLVILGTLVLVAFLSDSLYVLGTLLILSAILALDSGVIQSWKEYMRIALFISATILIFNLLLNDAEGTILFYLETGLPYLESVKLSAESIVFSSSMALRMMFVISCSTLASLTISFDDIILLTNKIGFPRKGILIAALSARFFPSLANDAKALSEVQKARGARLEGISGKAPIILPLLSNAIEKSVLVAETIEMRGLDNLGKRRTSIEFKQ